MDKPKRKHAHSWELTHTQQADWICINTLRANTLVREAIERNLINELSGYSKICGEVKYGGENSRVDLLLQVKNRVDCYIEVKLAAWLQQQYGYFPDAVTLRRQKHLRELFSVIERGQRAVLFFAVLHSGIEQVTPAHHIDVRYAALLAQVNKLGVKVVCYGAKLSTDSISISLYNKLPFFIDSVSQT